MKQQFPPHLSTCCVALPSQSSPSNQNQRKTPVLPLQGKARLCDRAWQKQGSLKPPQGTTISCPNTKPGCYRSRIAADFVSSLSDTHCWELFAETLEEETETGDMESCGELVLGWLLTPSFPSLFWLGLGVALPKTSMVSAHAHPRLAVLRLNVVAATTSLAQSFILFLA